MEIAISATLDSDNSIATVKMATMYAMKSLVDIDTSKSTFNNAIQKAIYSILDIDKSSLVGTVAKLEAMYSTMDVDNAKAKININNCNRVSSHYICESSNAVARIGKIGITQSDWNIDLSSAVAHLNSFLAASTVIGCDRTKAKLNYLYLKNPPLPPEIDGGIRIRSAKNIPLNKAQLVTGSTYTLDATVDGQRIEGVNFVFTCCSTSQIILLQKATINTPEEYLVTSTGIGDIMISNSTPITSGRLGTAEEVTTTIIIKPDEFKVTRNTVLSYQFWAYDALGTNTLLEAGTFSVGKA